MIVLNGAGQPATGVTKTLAADGKSVIITGLDDGATNSTTDGYQVFFTTDGVRFDRFLSSGRLHVRCHWESHAAIRQWPVAEQKQ